MSGELRPLRSDVTGADPTIARAVSLLASVRPLEPSAARQARVAEALKVRAHNRGRILLRPTIALGSLLATAAAAAAVSWWAASETSPSIPPERERAPIEPGDGPERAQGRALAATAVILAPPPASTPLVAPAPLAQPPLDAPLAPSVSEEALEAANDDAEPAVAAAPVAPAPVVLPIVEDEPASAAIDVPNLADDLQADEVPPEPAVAETPDDEASIVLFAASKLRRDKDPRATLHLLAFAANKFQDGALVQERIALEIEARLALGDARARELAERYVAQFPAGPFRALADTALRRFPK